MPEKNDIVTDICKRFVIGGISEFERDERGAQVMREERRGLWQTASVQRHGDLDRHCAGQVSRKYRYKRSSQQWHWYYAFVLGALSS